MTEPISITPEELEAMEYELLMNHARTALGTGAPLTSPTSGLGVQDIVALRNQLRAEHEVMRLQTMEDTKNFDRLVATTPMVTKCPLCGKPSLGNKTCGDCLKFYIAESEEWLRKYA